MAEDAGQSLSLEPRLLSALDLAPVITLDSGLLFTPVNANRTIEGQPAE